MKRVTPYTLILAAIAAAALILNGCGQQQPRNAADGSGTEPDSLAQNRTATSTEQIPRLVDLGAHKCIPCKMMAPILEELAAEYEGRMKIEFIDVWKNPKVGKAYGIRMIPTQIFFGADGEELFRHEGFYSKEDILNKWKELGYDFSNKAATTGD